jgi:hypothetical protein
LFAFCVLTCGAALGTVVNLACGVWTGVSNFAAGLFSTAGLERDLGADAV